MIAFPLSKANQSREDSTSNKPSSVNTNYKLSEGEKADIRGVHEAIAKAEKWVLKSDAIVEERMLKLANAAPYEYPVNSKTLDPDDPLWRPDYFLDADINETKEYSIKYLPLLSNDLYEEMPLYDSNWEQAKSYTSLSMLKYMTLDKKWR